MLDGIGRDPPNPTYTCVVKIIPRGQYITWKNALREKIGTSKQLMLRVRLNRLQTNFGNQFPENGAFGCDGKYYFPEIDFLLTEI